MEFDKLSLDLPMAQGNSNDDLLRDEAGTDQYSASSPNGHQFSNVESIPFPNEDQFCCDYISADTYRNRGPVLQFINQNCADAATIIGGARLPETDIQLLPAYLVRNRQLIKNTRSGNYT
jgi:hypothetical protein